MLDLEETYWSQKASMRWNLEGDRKTKLFHNVVKKRRLKSRIQSIEHGGRLITDQEEIVASAMDYFGSVLSDNIHISEELDLSHFSQTISDIQNSDLMEPPNLDEIKKAVFSLSCQWILCKVLPIMLRYH